MSRDSVSVSFKSDEAYRRLVDIINAGQLKTGEPLTEAMAVRLTGMSRGPVRESILRLEAQGILDRRGTRRCCVVGVLEDESQEEVLSRYEIREMVEPGAARLAAKNMNGWQIDRLCELVAELDHYFAVDREERLQLAMPEYHEYLVANCGNPMLYRMWEAYHLAPSRPGSERTNDLIRTQIAKVDAKPPGWAAVTEAIAHRDQDLAERLAKEEIRAFIEVLRRLSWKEITGNRNRKGGRTLETSQRGVGPRGLGKQLEKQGV